MARPLILTPQLRPDQARIAAHPAKRKYLSMGRRWGKTVLGQILILSALRIGLRAAWLVPTYRNSNPLWRAVESALGPARAAGWVRLNRGERYVEAGNGGFLGIYTGDNPDAMRGEAFHLVIPDEASRIGEAVMTDIVEPTLADYDGDLVSISSPNGKNWFYREYQRGRTDMHDVAAWQAPTKDNPNPRIQLAAERARTRFGEDSDTYRQEWLGEFVDSGALVWLPEWVTRYDPADPSRERRIIARYLSYDTASKDKDRNAYTACCVGELLDDYTMDLRHVWRERLLMPNLVDRIADDAKRWNYDGKLYDARQGEGIGQIVIEDQASGIGAYQTLFHSGDPLMQACLRAFNPKTSKEERFGNAGTWVKRGWFRLPRPGPDARWLKAFEDEMFEEQEFVDQRDAVAQLILWLESTFYRGVEARGQVAA